jgi:maltose alpha-D-glucosyltransferase/alpha-amylase
MYNALQPGVFALSGWDLAGNVTLRTDQVRGLIRDGDTRWIHRGAHDLMGSNPSATASGSGMPRARSLYGTLPEQLADPESFAYRLSRVLAVRKQLGIAAGALLEVPDVAQPAVLVMVNFTVRGLIQLTVLNFSADDVVAEVASDHLDPGCAVVDGLDEDYRGVIADDHRLTVPLAAYQGRALVVEPAAEQPQG